MLCLTLQPSCHCIFLLPAYLVWSFSVFPFTIPAFYEVFEQSTLCVIHLTDNYTVWSVSTIRLFIATVKLMVAWLNPFLCVLSSPFSVSKLYFYFSLPSGGSFQRLFMISYLDEEILVSLQLLMPFNFIYETCNCHCISKFITEYYLQKLLLLLLLAPLHF